MYRINVDTVGEFNQAATGMCSRAANRERRVGAFGFDIHHSFIRIRLMAAAVIIC